jgi:geranylgeranyl pyrophosphate synthase
MQPTVRMARMYCAGKETVNSMYGTRTAVLAGDFLFAESSAGLARLDNLEVRLQHLCVLQFHLQALARAH